MGRLSLDVLGTPQLRHGARKLSLVTRKAQALLIYLAVEGGLHARARVADVFWPASDDAHGRGSLRSTLGLVQGALRQDHTAGAPERDEAAHLVVKRDLLGVSPAGLDLDLQTLQAAFTLARGPARLAPDELVAHLQPAVALYRGPFLDGFSLNDAPDFDEWASVQRETWHRRMDLVLDRLSQALLDGGDLVAALETAARWVAFDTLNEAAHRRVIFAELALGNRAAALRAYEACRAVLAAELNAAPAPQTEVLAARARARDRGGGTAAVAARSPQDPLLGGVRPRRRRPGPPAVRADGSLVGRLTEHARLVAAYRAARRGALQVALVEGEGGIGKTRLVAEFLHWAAAQGAEVLQGRAGEAGGRLPYHPLVEALRERLAADDPRRLLPSSRLAELSRLVPELRERYPDLGEPCDAREPEARARMFEAVVHLGFALAGMPAGGEPPASQAGNGRSTPVVLFVDDLQWADTASLDVLSYACRRWAVHAAPPSAPPGGSHAGNTPILLVLAARAEDMATDPALAGWLGSLGRDLPVTRVTLGPLTPADTLRLVQSLVVDEGWESPSPPGRQGGTSEASAPVPAPEAFSRWLFAETGGHPLFTIETVTSLVERGLARWDATEGWTTRTGTALPGSPDGLSGFVAPRVHDAIQARLAQLSPAARQCVTAGAVLGDGFTFATLRDVGGLGEDNTLVALDELLARRLLREHESPATGTTGYIFVHDKIREVAYREAGDARRRVLHRRAVEVLTPGEAGGTAPAATLAHHAVAAGLVGQTLRFSSAAGDEALRLCALHDAIAHYEHAWRVARATPAPPATAPPRHAHGVDLQHLSLRLGRTYELASSYAMAREVYDALLAWAGEWRDPQSECAALNCLATIAALELDLDTQAALLHRGRAVAEASGESASLVDMTWNLGRLSFFRSDFVGARSHAERALALARELGQPERIARCLNWLALARVYWGQWTAAQRDAEEARALYAALGDRAMEADSLVQLAAAHLRYGEPRAAVDAARAAYGISREMDNHWGQGDAARELALGLSECGEYAEALGLAEVAATGARAAGYPPLLTITLVGLGSLYRRLGRVEEACTTHAEAIEIATSLRFPTFVELAASELCADQAARGAWTEAYTCAQQALAARDQAVLYAGFSRWTETEALLRGGDERAAREDVAGLGRRIGANRRYRLPYLRALAMLAAWHGATDDALAHLHEAADLARAMALPGELWPVEGALGDLFQERGENKQSAQAYQRAASIVRSLAGNLADESLQVTFLAAEPVRRVLALSRR